MALVTNILVVLITFAPVGIAIAMIAVAIVYDPEN